MRDYYQTVRKGDELRKDTEPALISRCKKNVKRGNILDIPSFLYYPFWKHLPIPFSSTHTNGLQILSEQRTGITFSISFTLPIG